MRAGRILLAAALTFCASGAWAAGGEAESPWRRQVAELTGKLRAGEVKVRAAAAESFGFLRAYEAQDALLAALADRDALVRRQAAMSLAWCGGRRAVGPLLAALDDGDWLVRQSAHVALTNLTGQELPFDTTATPAARGAQARAWRDWWRTVPADGVAKDVLALLQAAPPVPNAPAAAGGPVSASSTYKGPPSCLRDGRLGPRYWQTKNVKFPQWCTVDLGKAKEISRVVVHQYSAKFVMTDCAISTSLDNKTFQEVQRIRRKTPVRLVVTFPAREARYVRVTSYGSVNPLYPTTFYEIEIDKPLVVAAEPRVADPGADDSQWLLERGLRALGALGGEGSAKAIMRALGPRPSPALDYRPAVRAGLRSLGRLKDPAALPYLLDLLNDTMWARYAADALGDLGDRRAVRALIEAYPKYAKNLKAGNPKALPRDDRMGFPSEDRMLETPYYIAHALCRLPLDDAADIAALRGIAPLILANLPGDHDTFMLYENEVGHVMTRYLLAKAGLLASAREYAFGVLSRPGKSRRPRRARGAAAETQPAGEQIWPPLPPVRVAAWLPCLCIDPADVPRLLALLGHENGWVRLNAAKALGMLGDRRAIEPIAAVLRAAKAEADFGYEGTFKMEEYKDPAPRWRQGLVRALGLLKAAEQVDLIARILNDERSVPEIRDAAAHALADIGTPKALAVLETAAVEHSVFCVRNTARDALRRAGRTGAGPVLPAAPVAPGPPAGKAGTVPIVPKVRASRKTGPVPVFPEALVFIKGSNKIPNTVGTVVQADPWRQTYVVTDSGPAYRPGRNLYVLRPVRPDGKVTPLTTFTDGWVSEPELSWDASHVLFSRRGGKDDPWWQVYRVNVDGTGLKQLTSGPYHSVGPCYLPDGRIVFASSRSGIRDEYHGYPCTVLCVMNPDGSGITPIANNIGRDNEPSVLHDGRIAFSRLEVFYSRNKTELTLHACHPDGMQDVVLYGPERRAFWRGLDHGPRSPADGQEAPLTHRVIRMTQPQPMPDGHNIVVATQGGLVLVDGRRYSETFITPDNKTRSYTTPFPLPDGRVLCASTPKSRDPKGIDLALYLLDPATQKLTLLYNDPATADFEPRPILPRTPPRTPAPGTVAGAYTGRFICSSVHYTQEPHVRRRGRFVRLVEGTPVIARHSTQTNPYPVWKNHGGTFARVLGTAPLAPDGSFQVEVPADRLMHFQVLDSDRRVLGNQLTWIYPRPGETKSCVGCHERPTTSSRDSRPLATRYDPVRFLPDGTEFTYRAKAWFKGSLPEIIDERTRTVRSVNLMGR